MDFERSDDFDETEVSESLHIDQIAYKDPRRSYSEGIFYNWLFLYPIFTQRHSADGNVAFWLVTNTVEAYKLP